MSDYDLDKLYIHRYATTINEEGKTVRIPSNLSPEDQMVFWSKNEYVKLTQEVLDQELVEALHTLGIIQGNNEDGTTSGNVTINGYEALQIHKLHFI